MNPSSKDIKINGNKAFNIQTNQETGYLNTAGQVVKQEAMKCGVYIRPLGDVVYLLPPLCINDDQLEKLAYPLISSGYGEYLLSLIKKKNASF